MKRAEGKQGKASSESQTYRVGDCCDVWVVYAEALEQARSEVFALGAEVAPDEGEVILAHPVLRQGDRIVIVHNDVPHARGHEHNLREDP